MLLSAVTEHEENTEITTVNYESGMVHYDWRVLHWVHQWVCNCSNNLAFHLPERENKLTLVPSFYQPRCQPEKAESFQFTVIISVFVKCRKKHAVWYLTTLKVSSQLLPCELLEQIGQIKVSLWPPFVRPSSVSNVACVSICNISGASFTESEKLVKLRFQCCSLTFKKYLID